jgi:hypothetical protein
MRLKLRVEPMGAPAATRCYAAKSGLSTRFEQTRPVQASLSVGSLLTRAPLGHSIREEKMNIPKADVLKYLSDTRSHYAQYHNHKEASAWAAAALYILFLIQIFNSINRELSCLQYHRIAVLLVIVVLAIAVIFYLKAQFRMRRNAANYIAACFALAAEYLVKEEAQINAEAFALVQTTDNQHHSPHILPKAILDKAADFDKIGHGTRKLLETSIYVVISVTTLVALVRILFFF